MEYPLKMCIPCSQRTLSVFLGPKTEPQLSVPDINFPFNFKELFVSSPKTDDKGGRRIGTDRRQVSYYFHISERRSGIDRRSGVDRRCERCRYRCDVDRRENF
jgi:hypothetical protein